MRIEAPGPIDSCFRGRALEPTAALIEETLTMHGSPPRLSAVQRRPGQRLQVNKSRRDGVQWRSFVASGAFETRHAGSRRRNRAPAGHAATSLKTENGRYSSMAFNLSSEPLSKRRLAIDAEARA